MLTIPIPQSRRNKRTNIRSASLPAPVLLSGTFDEESGLTLSFDQPVAVHAFKGSALTVNYPVQSQKFNASGTPVVAGATLQMSVVLIGTSIKPGLLLTATGDSRIASLAGVVWPGVPGFSGTTADHWGQPNRLLRARLF